jgi:phosphomannomutase
MSQMALFPTMYPIRCCRTASVTAKAVVDAGADFGIAWDGDFDRCFFFDENGRFIEGYYLVGLLPNNYLKNHLSRPLCMTRV